MIRIKRHVRSLCVAVALASLVPQAVAAAETPRNVILFLGDGMGVSTVTAARILAGQQRGHSGEEHNLSFETFDNVALVKTYNTNAQVPDSAGTMTAIMAGEKTRIGVVGVDASVELGDCGATKRARLTSLLEEAEAAGMLTGIISTARITHATPAATYAHSANRNWEVDWAVPEEHRARCPDIARQMIEFPLGDGIDVMFGGGRAAFFPNDANDPEHAEVTGQRRDGRHLVGEWLAGNPTRQYAWNTRQFRKLDRRGQALGLFEPSHMQFEADRAKDADGEPSLEAMVRFAIDRLKRGDNGYFLMVEAGRIDHGHHESSAYKALTDTIAFADAVRVADRKTRADDTLILVTADHSHTLTISGYPSRGNPILGHVAVDGEPQLDDNDNPYTTLSYANGPGYHRPDDAIDPTSRDYRQAATLPLALETHAGEDVAAYARGPNAEQVRGVMEQNELHAVMRGALTQLDR